MIGVIGHTVVENFCINLIFNLNKNKFTCNSIK